MGRVSLCGNKADRRESSLKRVPGVRDSEKIATNMRQQPQKTDEELDKSV